MDNTMMGKLIPTPGLVFSLLLFSTSFFVIGFYYSYYQFILTNMPIYENIKINNL